MAALSFENRLNDWLTARNMSVQTFAEVAKLDGISGASQARIFQALRDDKRSLPNKTVEELSTLKDEVEAMYGSFAPFALDLSDGKRVHEWLVSRREGRVFSVVVSGIEPSEKDGKEDG